MTDYHWTPALQRQFLEALAETGSVELACNDVSMSRRAAYNLRWKREGAAFRIGWDAAILVARAVVADELMDRALLGQKIETVRDPENNITTRTHYDRRLGAALLARLDRMAEKGAADAADARIGHIVSQDFEAFLELVAEGGQGAQAGLFVASRSSIEDRLFPGLDKVTNDLRIQCELAQKTAVDEARENEGRTPEIAAENMHVWWDEWLDGWRTDFPPSEDFDGYEEGNFADGSYSRTVSADEEALLETVERVNDRPFILAGQQAREAYFAELRAELSGKDCCQTATDEAQNDAHL